MSTPEDRDYVVGTHDAEIERLRLQHHLWRHRVLDCWRRAKLRRGYRVADIGAGPGYASLDLADLVRSYRACPCGRGVWWSSPG
jgi:hypothetical protein